MSQYYLLITSILFNLILGLALFFAKRKNQYLERLESILKVKSGLKLRVAIYF